MHSSPRESDYSSSSQAPTIPRMLTPDSDSDDSYGGDDFGIHGDRQASFKMMPPGGDARGKKSLLIEKGDARFPREEEEGESYGREERGDGGYESAETSRSYRLYTPDEEKAVVRKFDRRLVAFVAFLYMLSFLDRSNIGNARIAGLAWDLKLTSNEYEWILTAFYLSYISFEWMSILWKIVPAHIYVTVIVLSWGIVASLQSVVTSFTGLLILRLLLGIGEAGFTGIPFYLSFFFKREELALRTGLFISAAPLATSFASSLGYFIVLMGKYVPIAPWRLLFLLEGFPSVIVSLIAWHQIPDSPSKAYYLTKRQKRIARLRLRKEKKPSRSQGTTTKSNLKLRELWETLKDLKIWITAIMFFCTNMAFSSLPAYLPKILSEMDHDIPTSQALSAPPYLLAFIAVILTAYLSDRTQNRSSFIIFHALLSASGYAIIAIAGFLEWNNWIRYAAVYPAAVGFFSVITVIITWNINNLRGEGGMGFAVLQLVGQCGPLVGTRLYPEGDAPYYVRGMTVCCMAMVMVAVLAGGLRWYLVRENVRNERQGVYDRVEGDDDLDETLVAMNGGRAGRRSRYMI